MSSPAMSCPIMFAGSAARSSEVASRFCSGGIAALL
jgi:hypothetical protein